MTIFEKSLSGIYLPGSVDRNTIRVGSVNFSAKNGMVCLSKELDNGEEEFRQCSPSEARTRREAIIALANDTRNKYGMSHAKVKFYEKFIDAYDRVIRAAEEQGPFENESARRDRVRRQPKSISVGIDLSQPTST